MYDTRTDMNQFRFLSLFALASLGAVASAAGFQNGSFEMGTDPGNYAQLNATDATTIAGWTVTSGSIDYIGSYWTASEGARSLDMSGSEAGAIAQTFDTIAGMDYLVTFDLAGNANSSPSTKALQVDAGGPASTYAFDATGKDNGNMGWLGQSFAFTATSASTTLTFTSLTGGSYGPALDNVSVQAVPEPATMAALGLGILGLRRRNRK